MAYDRVGESRRLIETRELTPWTSLSRRRRHVPMAVDVAGDFAVTMFARRSVGGNVEETHVLSRYGGVWTMLGGGGGPLADDALERRPAELPPSAWAPLDGLAGIARQEGAGGTLDSARMLRRRSRWISNGIVRVSAQVDRVEVDGG